MNVYRLNDTEYWVAESFEQALAHAKDVCGDDCYDESDQCRDPIPTDELKKLAFFEEDHSRAGSLFDQLRYLIESGEKTPTLLAAEDW